MDVSTLKKEVASHISDPAMRQVTGRQILSFLNSAARDAASRGIYIPLEEDESLELASNDYDYTVPSGFITIAEVWLENTTQAGLFDRLVPRYMWRLGLDAGVPVLRFNSDVFDIEAGKNLKLVGQKRPSTYTDDADTLDPGLESFLRERTISYSARYLARGGSNYSRQYATLAQESYATSELFLSSSPQEFRMRPDSRKVLGR